MTGIEQPRTYVQIVERLRVQRGAGEADLVSQRPVRRNAKGERVAFADDPDTAPTLVTFDERCQVNIPFLLRTGAIREHVAPAETSEAAAAPSTPRRTRTVSSRRSKGA